MCVGRENKLTCFAYLVVNSKTLYFREKCPDKALSFGEGNRKVDSERTVVHLNTC